MPTKKYFVVLPTVGLAGRYWIVSFILALLTACAPVNSLTSTRHAETDLAKQDNQGNSDHNTLARQYENLAEEMQARAQETKVILEHKSHSSHFGKNWNNFKLHAEFKVRKYEQAAEEYREKAAYHRTIMAIKQANHQTAAESGKPDDNNYLDKLEN